MNKRTMKMAALFLIMGMGILLLRKFDVQYITPAIIRDYILSFGVWAPIFYIFLYAVRPLVFFPAILLTLSGGLTFGPWWGTLYDLIGASLGAYLAFGISRYLGRETIQKWLGNRLQLIDDKVGENGFRTILILRLIPLFPFDAINYGAGLSKIRFQDYAWGTTIGIIPGAFAYNFLGHSLHHVFSTTFYAASGLVLFLILLPTVYKWVKKRKVMKSM